MNEKDKTSAWDRKQKRMRASEADKAKMTLPQMLEWLNENPLRHTPFFDLWFRTCLSAGQMVYPIKRNDASVGKRLLHGNPQRVVEIVESAAGVGKPGIFFCKAVA